MKYNNTVEYQDAISRLVHRNLEVLRNCKDEEREMTEDEEKEFNSIWMI